MTCYDVTVLDNNKIIQRLKHLTASELTAVIDNSATQGYTVNVKTIKATLQ